MEEPLKNFEIDFCEQFYNPTALSENLIPINENAPQTWDENCDCITFRNYQIMMQDFSYLVANDRELSPKQNMRKRIGAGKIYNIGSRNSGKSYILKINTVLSIVHKIKEMCIASFDAKHLKNVTNPISAYIESHPFLKIFHLRDTRSKTVKRDPLTVATAHGALVKSANELVEGNDPGVQFHSLHYEKLEYEEFSYASDEGTKKRIDSGSSLGHIERLSGIPDLRIGSPLTKLLSDPKNKRYIWRLPQYVRQDFDSDTEQELAEKYNGKSSFAYKLNVEAEIIEGAFGFWDMERLKQKCLRQDKRIKYFEISKDNFHRFEELLIIDKLAGAEQTYITADLGYGNRPTEIIIIFKSNGKYKYVYNISLFKLISDEQIKIFKWLYDKLGGAYIGLDNTSDHGVIADALYKLGIPNELITKVDLNSNIEVGFIKDENDNVKRDKTGKPMMRKENTIQWAMTELEKIIYNGEIEIPIDQKFLKEFNGFVAKQVGMRKVFDSVTTDDLHQSIVKNEVVVCKIDGNFIVDYVENIFLKAQNKKIEVPTFFNGKLIWKKAELWREKNKGNKIVDFKFKPGSFVDVTEGHSMLVWNSDKQKLEEKTAKDVKVGDLVLNIDKKCFNANNDYQYLNHEYWTKKGRKWNKTKIKLDEDLAYLLGIYTAEGSLSGNEKNRCINLYVGTDLTIAKYIKELAEKVFRNKGNISTRTVGTQVAPDKVCKTETYTVVFYGQKIAELFSKLCGRGAKNKKVPNEIYNSPKSVIQIYLNALIEGDGNKEGKLTTTSRLLANGVYILNAQLGNYSALYRVLNKYNNYEYYIKSAVRNGYFRNIPRKAFEIEYSENNGKTINREKLKNSNFKFATKFKDNKEILKKVHDFNFLEVKEKKYYDYNDYVYDFYVPETNNFVAGVGNIVVHNSFQIFAITKFFNEFNVLQNFNNQDTCWGIR